MGAALGSIIPTIMIAHMRNINRKSAEVHVVVRAVVIASPISSIPSLFPIAAAMPMR